MPLVQALLDPRQALIDALLHSLQTLIQQFLDSREARIEGFLNPRLAVVIEALLDARQALFDLFKPLPFARLRRLTRRRVKVRHFPWVAVLPVRASAEGQTTGERYPGSPHLEPLSLYSVA